MRYEVRRSVVQVVGKIWLPPVTCAHEYVLREYDLANIGPWNRKNVEHWLMLNSGDFQSIEDFRADFDAPGRKHWESNWKNPDSEFTFTDCMYGSEQETA